MFCGLFWTLPIPGHREAFLVFFFSLLEGSLPQFFFFPQLFMRALPHEKCVAIFQESYSLMAFQHGQRNLAISDYSSEVVSFPECQHSLAMVESTKIFSPKVTTQCFLQTVILHRRLWGGKNTIKPEAKPNKTSLIKHNKPTTPIPKYASSQYYDEFYCLTNFQRSFIVWQLYFRMRECSHPFQLFYKCVPSLGSRWI